MQLFLGISIYQKTEIKKQRELYFSKGIINSLGKGKPRSIQDNVQEQVKGFTTQITKLQ